MTDRNSNFKTAVIFKNLVKVTTTLLCTCPKRLDDRPKANRIKPSTKQQQKEQTRICEDVLECLNSRQTKKNPRIRAKPRAEQNTESTKN